MPVEKKSWSCTICGTVYDDPEKAAVCERAGKKALPAAKPWHWYRLKCGDHERDIFAYDVRTVKCGFCRGRHLEIYSYCSNDCYCAPTNWKIIGILSPMEMAERFGKLPSIFFNDNPCHPMNRPEPPEEVGKELERVFDWYRRSETARLVRIFTPEGLALKYLEAKYPHLNLF